MARRLATEAAPPNELQRLLERLSHLPDRLADLPAAAAALPGGWDGAGDAGAQAKRPPPRGPDTFTARQRKKQELMGHL